MENNLSGAAKIKVLGVGGGGNNAINNMIDAGIKSAEFVAINTDQQALLMSHAPNTLVIGKDETNGLGAGADPTVGEKAALASRNEIREQLKNVNLLFITAGMGGGTGTGAAPIIASIANELNILTVAVVTKPFAFEGRRRMMNAERGIENLRKFVDTLVVIPNQKLLEVLPQNTTMVEAFLHADEVLRKAIQGISDLIVIPSMINLDFADVRTIMRKRGLAHMGIGEAEGPDRMLKAVRQAVMSPLLETNIGGSSGIILNIVGGVSLTLNEVDRACKKVQEAVDESANIIFGAGIDETLGETVRITLIATGFGINEKIDSYSSQIDGANQSSNLVPINSAMSNDEFTLRFDNEEQYSNSKHQNTVEMSEYEENNFSGNNNNSFNQLANGVTTNFVGNKVTTPNNNISPNGFFQQARPTLTLNGNAFTSANNVGYMNNTVNPSSVNNQYNKTANPTYNGNGQSPIQSPNLQKPGVNNNVNNGNGNYNQNNGYSQNNNYNQGNGYNNQNGGYNQGNNFNNNQSGFNNNQTNGNNQNGQNNDDNSNFPPFLNRLKRK